MSRGDIGILQYDDSDTLRLAFNAKCVTQRAASIPIFCITIIVSIAQPMT